MSHQDVLNLPPSGAAGPTDGMSVDIPDKFRAALYALWDAHRFARSLDRPAWDFAVELSCLRGLGLSNSDCRWLIGAGLVEHAAETTEFHHEHRSFTPCANLALREASCFVLTEAGIPVARRAAESVPVALDGRNGSQSANATRGDGDYRAHEVRLDDARPHWDRQRQELRVGGRLVKRYKVPAANQEIVLAAFEEENWPPRIDDPLPVKADLDAKRRLHDTINSLNRNQKDVAIRFLGDGSGQGVRWEHADSLDD